MIHVTFLIISLYHFCLVSCLYYSYIFVYLTYCESFSPVGWEFVEKTTNMSYVIMGQWNRNLCFLADFSFSLFCNNTKLLTYRNMNLAYEHMDDLKQVLANLEKVAIIYHHLNIRMPLESKIIFNVSRTNSNNSLMLFVILNIK